MKKLSVLTVALLLAACGGESSGPDPAAADAIDRELFVETMVELRMEALDNTPMVITEQEKAEILGERGLTEEDLRVFVETHGKRLEYMRDLWADIEARVLSRIDPDAAADSAGNQG